MKMSFLGRSLPCLLQPVLIALPFAAAIGATPARAGIILSKVIVDMPADLPPREDIEVMNDGQERQYVVADPALIQEPGTLREKRIDSPDPTITGLLVTPQKLVLEPGERKLIRVALVAPRDDAERIYRLAIHPVAGSVEAENTALKVFVGYDILIIARPATVTGKLTATRTSTTTIVFHNGSNSSVEMSQGRQCDDAGSNCTPLPATRLYAGADWSVAIARDTSVKYKVQRGKLSTDEAF
jgi:P pilus assembly chaperone PapD